MSQNQYASCVAAQIALTTTAKQYIVFFSIVFHMIVSVFPMNAKLEGTEVFILWQ